MGRIWYVVHIADRIKPRKGRMVDWAQEAWPMVLCLNLGNASTTFSPSGSLTRSISIIHDQDPDKESEALATVDQEEQLRSYDQMSPSI